MDGHGFELLYFLCILADNVSILKGKNKILGNEFLNFYIKVIEKCVDKLDLPTINMFDMYLALSVRGRRYYDALKMLSKEYELTRSVIFAERSVTLALALVNTVRETKPERPEEIVFTNFGFLMMMKIFRAHPEVLKKHPSLLSTFCDTLILGGHLEEMREFLEVDVVNHYEVYGPYKLEIKYYTAKYHYSMGNRYYCIDFLMFWF